MTAESKPEIPEIELPELNITSHDHEKYDAEWETRWDGYPVDSICAELYCRERQLCEALGRIASLESQLSQSGWQELKPDTQWEEGTEIGGWFAHGWDVTWGVGEFEYSACLNEGWTHFRRSNPPAKPE